MNGGSNINIRMAKLPKRKKFICYFSLTTVMKLDLLDKKILYELSIDAKASISNVAKRLRTSAETVNFRIKRLLGEKYLKGFYTLFNMSLTGYYYYHIFIKLNRTTSQEEKSIVERIRQQKYFVKLRICEGAYNICFMAIVKSPRTLARILQDLTEQFGEKIGEKEIHLIVRTHVFNQRMLFTGKTECLSFEQDSPKDRLLDKTDKSIIRLLATNARAKNLDIGAAIQVHPKVVAYRIKRLEQEKIIIGYVSSPNFEKFPFEFVQVNIRVKSVKFIPSIIEFFNQTNKCLFAFELLGNYDLLIELHIENDLVLRSILEKFKEKFLVAYHTYDVFHIYKEYVISWSPFELEKST